MAKEFCFLFYPGEYLRDTQCLSEGAQVAYDRIMCEHMRNITITQDQLNFFTKRLTPDQKAELIFILKKIGNDFQIEWVADSIGKRKAYSDSRSKNRTKTHDKHMNTYDNHMVIEKEIVIEDKELNEVEDAKVMIWPTFEDFWEAYDKKVDRPKSEQKWEKLKQEEKEKIMSYIPEYKKAQPDKTYRKNATTFLNNRSWENEIIKSNGNKFTNNTDRHAELFKKSVEAELRRNGNTKG